MTDSAHEFAETEWPEGYQMLMAIVEQMGTEWVRDAIDEIEEELNGER